MAKKVLIVGWDSAPPDHVFGKWLDDMPNLKGLVDGGAYGPIQSTDPPITCPAWQAMATSKNPGHLGCYGFRNRYRGKYIDFYVANSKTIRVDTMYTIMARKRKKLVMLGIPQTYPPRPVNGIMVCDFLAPGIDADYTYPPGLKNEIADVVGEYIIDVRNFRTEDKDWLLGEIYKMTDRRFELAKHFLQTKPWDFFQMVEMGPDRIQHGFWKFYDPQHFKYEAGNKYEKAIPEYYRHLDSQLGELVGMVDRNETAIIVVSDHGAKRMDGAVCINDWLIREGYLKLKSAPEAGKTVNITKADVDWANTVAWAAVGLAEAQTGSVGRPTNSHRNRPSQCRTTQDRLSGIHDPQDKRACPPFIVRRVLAPSLWGQERTSPVKEGWASSCGGLNRSCTEVGLRLSCRSSSLD